MKDDAVDAARYWSPSLVGDIAQRQKDYNEALRRLNMNSSIMTHQGGMSAVNQSWPHAGGLFNQGASNGASAVDMMSGYRVNVQHHFNVEKVDNGFIIRSGKYTKVCNSMDELKDQFVAIMVEATLDK